MEKNSGICKSCGSRLMYNPQTKALKCESCGACADIIVSRAKEHPFEEALNKTLKNKWEKSAKSVQCEQCGAIEILNKGDLSDVCPFCGHTNIVDIEQNNMLLPTAIMPFTISKAEAKAAFISSIKKDVWAPKNLKKQIKLKEPVGVYTPVFSFDADVFCSYSGTLCKEVTKVIHGPNGDTRITVEKDFRVNGSTSYRFDDYLVDAGQNITGVTLKKLEPFDSNNSVEFDDRFLYGYSANYSKKNIRIAYKQAEDAFRAKLEEHIIRLHNATRAKNIDQNLIVENLKYKYILLPVYLDGFTYKNRTYTLYCNGTTSKVVGKLPVSKTKVWSVVLSAISITILALLITIFV